MANPFVVACPVWGFVHTRFQISNKEFVIISMKEISGQLELKYIKAKNLKIKRSRFCGDLVLFWIALVWLDVWFSGGHHNFPSLSLVSAFSLYCFYRSFSPWFNCPFFFAAIIIRQCSTATAKLPANSMGYLCCGRSGVKNLCFIGRRHDSVDRRFDEVW